VFVSVLLCAIRVDGAFATSIVGVEVGRWAMYTIAFDTNGTRPIDFSPNRMCIEVLGIAGTNITYKMTYIWANGSSTSSDIWGDIETGNGTAILFIGANLTQGDLIYPSNPLYKEVTINETDYRNYLNETLQVNHFCIANWTSPYPDGNSTVDSDYCWIKTSGLIAEMCVNQTIQYRNGTSLWYTNDMIISETGVVPESLSFLILPLFVLATLLAVIVCKRKREKSGSCFRLARAVCVWVGVGESV